MFFGQGKNAIKPLFIEVCNDLGNEESKAPHIDISEQNVHDCTRSDEKLILHGVDEGI